MSGHAKAMDSIMASDMPGHYKPSFQYKKDLDKAKQLLTEAGYPEWFSAGIRLDLRAWSVTAGWARCGRPT